MWCQTDDRIVDQILVNMRKAHIDVIDLADMADIKPSNLVRILNRNYSPNIYIYERIANVLNCKIYLL